MKVLVLQGSPSADGSTSMLARSGFPERARALGASL